MCLQNLLELVEANEDYSKFLQLLKDANLTDLLANANRSMTILVPKNDIFSEVKEYYDELKSEGNEKLLEDVIKSHIIDGMYWVPFQVVFYLSKFPIVCCFAMREIGILIIEFFFYLLP